MEFSWSLWLSGAVGVNVGSTVGLAVWVGDDEAFDVAVGAVLVVGEGETVGFNVSEGVGEGVGFGVVDGDTVEVGLFVGGVVGLAVGCAVGLGVAAVPPVIVIEGVGEWLSAKLMFSCELRAEADITNWSAPADVPVI